MESKLFLSSLIAELSRCVKMREVIEHPSYCEFLNAKYRPEDIFYING